MKRSAKRLIQPRVRGLQREPASSALDPRVKDAVHDGAVYLNVSESWLVHTILADALDIDLEQPLRAYTGGRIGRKASQTGVLLKMSDRRKKLA